ncbi:MAG: hypothetical protein ABFC71_02055 [Methanoregula sp.]
MNTYEIRARLFPSLLSAIPALIFQYFFLNPKIAAFLKFLGTLEFIGDITLSIAIVYFFYQLNRLIAKTFFEKEEIFMPTTNFLLFSDSEYSNEYKQKIFKKIKADFKIQLPSEDEQKTDERNSRQRIAEAMSLVRKKVGDGSLTLQHNTEYGFWRNLIGGAVISSLISLIDIYFAFIQSNNSILIVSSAFFVGNLILLILNKQIIDRAGKFYARVLIQEYIAKF